MFDMLDGGAEKSREDEFVDYCLKDEYSDYKLAYYDAYRKTTCPYRNLSRCSNVITANTAAERQRKVDHEHGRRQNRRAAG